MPKYDTGFDLLSKNLEKVLSANAEGQKARTDFQNSLLLAKMKANYEQQVKQGEMKDKFGYDLLLKQAETPGQKWAREQYEKQEQGNPGGAPKFTRGPDGEVKTLGFKDMVERVYMKPPDQWTPQDKQIIEQYKNYTNQAITDNQGNVVGYRPKGSTFAPKSGAEDMSWMGESQPAAQPAGQPQNILPQGITEEDIAHTMKLHSLTRDEVLGRIK